MRSIGCGMSRVDLRFGVRDRAGRQWIEGRQRCSEYTFGGVQPPPRARGIVKSPKQLRRLNYRRECRGCAHTSLGGRIVGSWPASASGMVSLAKYCMGIAGNVHALCLALHNISSRKLSGSFFVGCSEDRGRPRQPGRGGGYPYPLWVPAPHRNPSPPATPTPSGSHTRTFTVSTRPDCWYALLALCVSPLGEGENACCTPRT